MMGLLLQGVLLGGYYAILAAGLAFLYSVMGIINLAHGAFAVVAAYMLLVLSNLTGISPFLGLALILPIMAIIGVIVERTVFEPSNRGGPLLAVLATFGLSVVIDNLLFQQFGANTKTLANHIGDLSWASWDFGGGLYVGKLSVYTFFAAVIVLGGLQLLLTYAPVGRAIRATAQDSDTAGLIGLDARRIRMISAAIAFVTIGIAGAALGMRASFTPYAGGALLLFAFQATIIGGTHRVWGTLIGGVILGLAQTLGAQIAPQGFLIGGNLVFFAALFIRLMRGNLNWRKLISYKQRAMS
ncbi:branched-chain amino acid ABC transporter permease [Shimia sp.]|uniref:branched-chain amino acid ABC transporter permease n=1 Tax=Shimia sp. TaxID=1954381 RepID=UPI003297C300